MFPLPVRQQRITRVVKPSKIRVVNSHADLRQPGDYRAGVDSDGTPVFGTLACAGCGRVSSSGVHEVTKNSDGTFSFAPSIVCQLCNAHYFVQNDEITWV